MPDNKTPEWAMKAAEELADNMGEMLPSGPSSMRDAFVRDVSSIIAAHAPQARQLARVQPCGCVICTCAGEEGRCYGCGAKSCGTHPGGEFPEPVYVDDGNSATQAAESAAPVPEEEIRKIPFHTEIWDELGACLVDANSKLQASFGYHPNGNAATDESDRAAVALNERPALLSALQIAERAIADLLEQFTAYADNNWLGTGKWRNRIGLDEARDNGKQALSTIRALRPAIPPANKPASCASAGCDGLALAGDKFCASCRADINEYEASLRPQEPAQNGEER